MSPALRRQPVRSDRLLGLFAAALYVPAIGRYGLRIAVAGAVCLLVGLGTELLAAKLRKRRCELLAYPCWILLPLVLPPVFPLWMVGASTFFAAVVGLAFFGGHGRAVASPVALGWAFAALSFTSEFGFGWSLPFPDMTMGFEHYTASVLTIDHPIEVFSSLPRVDFRDIVLGDFPQTPGNAIPLLTLALGLGLLVLRAVDFRSCLSFLGTVALLSFAGNILVPQSTVAPMTLLIGNFVVASLFVLPDPRTAGRTFTGRWLTGAVAGVVAFVIRSFSGFPCGVFFAVLFANVFSPIIDEAVLGVKYRKAEQPTA